MSSKEVTPDMEQRITIKFLVKKRVKLAEILRRLNAQYGEKSLCRASI